MQFEILSGINQVSIIQKQVIADFLFQHLDQYGDPKEHIMKCLDYSLSMYPHQGGVVVLAKENDQIRGAVVVNSTGMEGYVPENLLVYIAVHKESRGIGLGKQLMQKAMKNVKGDIALHVEPDNPAKFLYEKLGFANKYLEMRYKNS